MWGQHLMVDMSDCNRAAITSEPTIRAFCAELVDRLGMTPFGEPMLAHFAKHNPAASGYTLVQLIETSNITAHFVETSGDIYLDVFSCKAFTVSDVIDVCRSYFLPKILNPTSLSREAGHPPRLISSVA